jgi:hypothetical protein
MRFQVSQGVADRGGPPSPWKSFWQVLALFLSFASFQSRASYGATSLVALLSIRLADRQPRFTPRNPTSFLLS